MGRLTPQEIREHDFKQTALGFNREQVHQFLDDIAVELETLIRESNALHVENKEARLTLKTYLNVEDSLKETLLLAQKTAQDTLKSAQNEADNILRKARTERDALLFTAKEDLADIQKQIRQLNARRESVLLKLTTMLRSNLELLEAEFTPGDRGISSTVHSDDERIVDFSRTDLVVEDLAETKDVASPSNSVESFED